MSRRAMLMSHAVLVGWLLAGTPAQATPIYFSSVNVSASDLNPGGTNQDINTGQLLSVDTVAAITASNSEASAIGFVNDGVIGAFASAESMVSDAMFVTGDSHVQFGDTLTLTSGSLPTGTPVNLLFTLDLSVILQSTQTPSMGGGCGSVAHGTLLVARGTSALADLVDLQEPSPCSVNDIVASPLVVSANIGDQLVATLGLEVAADGRIGGGSSADARDTLQFFADPIGDFSYTTASGNTYQSPTTNPGPVPEPATVALLGTAIGPCLVLALRRKRWDGRS
jgi:hypothetical protein